VRAQSRSLKMEHDDRAPLGRAADLAVTR
jgi:hypothetical protein